ncbi:MAG: hypothetical protein ACI9FJ_000670 [Alteromonadaceae bacterium]|jgi:hypothetical protein
MYISERYQKRNIVAAGVETYGGIAFKAYEINYAGKQVCRQEFERGVGFALTQLADKPSYQQATLGFMIKHAGNQCNYLIMAWWANENECFIEVFISECGNYDTDPVQWRAAIDESFCIWDLQVINAERNQFVDHISCNEGEVDASAYLADFAFFGDESKVIEPN